MTSSECSDSSTLSTCIYIFILVVILLKFRNFLKKVFRRIFEDHDPEVESSEISDALKFKEHVLELQDLARKVSDDKSFLVDLGSPDSFSFNGRTLIEVSEKYSSIQCQIDSVLNEAQRTADEQFLTAQKLMEAFGEDFLRFRHEVEDMVTRTAESRNKTVVERTHFVEKVTETEEKEVEQRSEDELEEGFMKELQKNENLNAVLFAVKSCMDKIIEDSRWNWKKTVLDISEFLAQNYEDIKAQLATSVKENAEGSEQTQLTTFNHMKVQTNAIEKQMLDIFLKLDRLVVDFQAVYDALEFFNRKFVHFSEKCNSEWDSHCARHDRACLRIQGVRDDLDASAALLSEAVRRLSAQSPQLSDWLGRLESAVRWSVAGDSVGSRTALEVVVASAEDARSSVERIEKEFASRMNYLSKKLTKPGEQLDTLLQTIEDLEVLDDLIKKIATAYACTVAAAPRSDLGDAPSVVPDVSKRFLCQDDDATEASVAGSCRGRSPKFNSPSRQIISILDDAISKTQNELSKNQIIIQKRGLDGTLLEVPGGKSMVKETNNWSSNLSDITLNTDSEYDIGKSVHSFISEE